jgi:hypothetical protein
MTDKTPHAEKATALAHSGGSIGSIGLAPEQAHAEGVYHGICRGYKGQHEAEYLREYPRLLAMRAQRDKLLRFTPTFAVAIIAKLMKELQAFEDYMHSLTEVKWDQLAHNTVVTVGKNAMLDAALAGSSYTVAGPYMGLIGAVGYSAIVAGDTMTSHAGWTEGGGTNAPTYTGPRKTIAWSAASAGSKAPSSAPVFAITGSGTAKGVFLVYGSGAVATLDSTAGVLFSAGLFSGGDQAVVNTNTLTVTYSIGL